MIKKFIPRCGGIGMNSHDPCDEIIEPALGLKSSV